jgi:phosphatidylglycerophosphate synthase
LRPTSYYLINGITLYRLVAAPVLVVLVFTGHVTLFSWLLPVSFFTDLIDGTLARRYKVSSVFGSRLDSIADDLTILAGVIGMFVLKAEFVWENALIVGILIALLVIQNIAALARYGRISSFHTWLAKIAAVIQGTFLILMFLLPEPIYPLFYAAAIVSALDLVEEIILVAVLREWKTDVKGLYWVLSRRNP